MSSIAIGITGSFLSLYGSCALSRPTRKAPISIKQKQKVGIMLSSRPEYPRNESTNRLAISLVYRLCHE